MEDWMETVGWSDVIDVFRPSVSSVASFQAVAASQGLIGKKHATDNYDAHGSFSGQSKVNNLVTSDKVHLPLGVDLRAGDVVRIREGGPDAEPQWFTVAGAPKRRTILRYTKAFLTTAGAPPAMLGGDWGEPVAVVSEYPKRYEETY